MRYSRLSSTLYGAIMFIGLMPFSVHADVTLNAGSSTFNFDTDGSGDFALQRGGFTNVLENASFFIWVSTEGSGNIRQLTGATDNGGQIDFAPEMNIPSLDPDTLSTETNGMLNASLVFTNFYENAQGHAVLDYEFRVNGTAIHSNPGALRTRIRLFSLFDYDGNGAEESFANANGDVILKDVAMAPGEGSAFLPQPSPSFAKGGVFDLDSGAFTETSFMSTPLATTGTNLAVGHWQTFVVPLDDPLTGPQDFQIVMKGSISAVPEPSLLAGLVLLMFAVAWYRPRRRETGCTTVVHNRP